MKKYLLLLFSFFFFLLTALDPVYYEYHPVFMFRDEMEANVKLENARSIQNPGKIYLKGPLIFINEKYRGIHVIDNTNPENPLITAFIKVDGCLDIAVKHDVLYADNAVDLIALKLEEDFNDVVVVKRLKHVFPEMLSPDGRELTWKERRAVPEDAILVRWDKN